MAEPHDPEAEVVRTKDGACDRISKPEHITDLESGAIVRAEVRPGDAADNDESLCERVMEAVATLSEVMPETPLEKLGAELCADEGYFAIKQIAQLQACAVRTVIADPPTRRPADPAPPARPGPAPNTAAPSTAPAVRRAARAAKPCCANGTNTSNAAFVMCSTTAACGVRPCVAARNSPNASSPVRSATI